MTTNQPIITEVVSSHEEEQEDSEFQKLSQIDDESHVVLIPSPSQRIFITTEDGEGENNDNTSSSQCEVQINLANHQ